MWRAFDNRETDKITQNSNWTGFILLENNNKLISGWFYCVFQQKTNANIPLAELVSKQSEKKKLTLD